MSVFYVVATPIGNLEDITLRAIRILKEVDLILCEDTRVTKRLLNRLKIENKQLTTYNERRSGISVKKVINFLKSGKNLALVTDAGTPGISDPGNRLVESVRNAGFTVVTVPGPSAITAALSISGASTSGFLFLGFLPHKKGRETLFKEIATSERPVVFYESPYRILKTLESLEYFAPGRKIGLARELTKVHEEFLSGTPGEMVEYFSKNKDKVRGEFTVIVLPR